MHITETKAGIKKKNNEILSVMFPELAKRVASVPAFRYIGRS